jgi:tellurite resistance protein TerC
MRIALRPIRRTVVFVLGMSVLIIGVAMIVLPGPAVLVIPAGLGILSLEFVWAGKLLKKARDVISRTVNAKSAAPTPPANP